MGCNYATVFWQYIVIMTLKCFGLNLARARAAKGLSAYELSLKINRAPNYIHRIEYGSNTSVKTVFEICEILEIDPKELFCDVRHIKPN